MQKKRVKTHQYQENVINQVFIYLFFPKIFIDAFFKAI